MKTRKFLASSALALSMALSPAAAMLNALPVAAAEISVQDTDNHTYDVYQIFTGSLDDKGSLSDIKWGKNAASAYTEGEDVPDAVIKALLDVNTNGKTDREKLDVIEQYVNLKSTKYGSVSKDASLDNVPAGYYLIKESASVEGTNDAATLFLAKVVGDVNVQPKKAVPTVQKKVQDKNDSTGQTTGWQDSADYDFGDNIPFQLKATLPGNYADYDSYKLKFNDTYDANALTYVAGSLKVYVDGTEIPATSGNTVQWTLTPETPAGTFAVEITNLKAVKNTDGSVVATTNSSVVTVEYYATLKDTADLGKTSANTNVVNLQFSNNPNTGGSGDMGKTPDDTVRVFTYKLTVTKTDNQDRDLNGAGFTLYKNVKGEDGETTKTQVKVITSADVDNGNVFVFEGLDDGEYVLEETEVPSGYSKAADVEFTITADHEEAADNPLLKTINIDSQSFAVDDNTGLVTTKVVNSREGNLPETGGMGTTMFYIAGTALVAGAAVIFVTNKRTRRN